MNMDYYIYIVSDKINVFVMGESDKPLPVNREEVLSQINSLTGGSRWTGCEAWNARSPRHAVEIALQKYGHIPEAYAIAIGAKYEGPDGVVTWHGPGNFVSSSEPPPRESLKGSIMIAPKGKPSTSDLL